MPKLLALLLYLLPLPATAMLYEWTGTCTFWCSGTASAIFTVRDDYVTGSVFDCGILSGPCPILDVRYQDDKQSMQFSNSREMAGHGRFPDSDGDDGYLFVGMTNWSRHDIPFWSDWNDEGRWIVYTHTLDSDGRPLSEQLAMGVNGRFVQRVPEPGMLMLLLAGLVGMGVARSMTE